MPHISTAAGAIKFLQEYGRLSKAEAKNPKAVKAAIKQYQEEFGFLKVDGVAGDLTKKAMNIPRCGVSDRLPYREKLRWTKTSLTYQIAALPPSQVLSTQDMADIIKLAGDKWTGCCGLLEWRPNKKGENPDVVISTGSGRRDGFDGPGRTLAWAELPDGRDTPKRLKYDVSEIWDVLTGQGIPFLTTTEHELGHIFGLDHSSNPADLMYPTLNKAISGPQAGDVARMVAEYGNPESAPGPTGYKEYTLRVPGELVVLGWKLTEERK